MQRKTFAKVAYQKHPDATGERIAASLMNGDTKASKQDVEIAEEILRVHEYLKKESVATGEWKWINDNKRAGYMKALNGGDRFMLAEYLANMFRRDAAYGIITGDYEGIQKKEQQFELENQVLLDLDVLAEFDGSTEMKTKWLKDHSKCGNPFGYLTQKNELIIADAPRHVYFANRLLGLLADAKITAPTVLEIGGGYGGLCLETIRRAKFKKFQYIDCDLPETLYMAYFFLKKALPKGTRIEWALEKVPNADVVLLPAQKKHLIKKADLMFNANSLSEMGKQTVWEYIALLHRLKPTYFYHQNSNYVLFPDSVRHIEVIASEFPIKEALYKKVSMSLVPWQGAGGRYREYLYKKK
jgi:putative sugar O-methyltransferase